MSDLIDRQAAIEAVLHHGEIENNYTDLYYDGYCDGVYDSADMLKDLPSAQPTQINAPNVLKSLDCISRQDAIDAIRRDPMGGLNYERILKYLPTAEPKTGRWIPVSERLPEDVLCVTLVTDGIDVWAETWVGVMGKWKYNHSAITAWMPLPEPYEERSEDNG